MKLIPPSPAVQPASTPIPAQGPPGVVEPPLPTPVITKTQMALNAGLSLVNTAVVGLAPQAGQLIASNTGINPNPISAGGVETLGIAAGMNGLAQWLKNFVWFDQNKWLIPILIVAGGILAILIWREDIPKIVVNVALALDKALRDYGLLKPLGVYTPGVPTKTDVLRAVGPGVGVDKTPAI